MQPLSYFKAPKETNRFKQNQKVWIRYAYANHMDIRFKWRGKGRYVNGIIDNGQVPLVLLMEVGDEFAERIKPQ